MSHAPLLDRSEPPGDYVTTLEVVGTVPVTHNVGGNKRLSHREWVEALDAAAAEAASRARPAATALFSLRIELRLYSAWDQGSDLDNYVKPIQDALAEHGIFGPVRHPGSSMRGDERVDHLDLRRKRVGSKEAAGVLVEVWALHE
jgi:Holliday junction resolvase RusA-like endonuclease